MKEKSSFSPPRWWVEALCQKVEGHISPVSDVRLTPADTEQIIKELYQTAERTMDQYLSWGDDDDSFSLPSLAQIRVQLSSVLRTVVSQQLLPDCNGGMVPACEILHLNSAVRSLIRDNKNHQIDNIIASGVKEGMCSMDRAIASLCRDGKIALETALEYADNPEQLKRFLG
jgi:Tfp pilus assembly pilus retraction ATPase PilT